MRPLSFTSKTDMRDILEIRRIRPLNRRERAAVKKELNFARSVSAQSEVARETVEPFVKMLEGLLS